MQTSARGVAALELEEGVVLRAYRDSVGVWTIGAGLTAASGVIRPRPGMTITAAEATNLLQQALRERYEPAVEAAMLGARPHEFDAAVSFHWNTGAIGRASWVKSWKAKAAPAIIRTGLLAWSKAGGKVLPGLKARREREADMLLEGVYRGAGTTQALQGLAKWGLGMSAAEIAAVREGLATLGYDAGPNPAGVLIETARKFQGDHGLTVDGVIGRATLSTLQRRLDARGKAAMTATTSVPMALLSGGSGASDQLADLAWVQTAVWAGLALYALSLAWRYRDVVAAKINPLAPRLAALLRSF